MQIKKKLEIHFETFIKNYLLSNIEKTVKELLNK